MRIIFQTPFDTFVFSLMMGILPRPHIATSVGLPNLVQQARDFSFLKSFSQHPRIIGAGSIKSSAWVVTKDAILCHEYGTIGFGVFQEKRVVSYAKTN